MDGWKEGKEEGREGGRKALTRSMSQTGQIVHETLSRKHPAQKGVGGIVISACLASLRP
jgi:hypothetical protein